MTQNLTKDFIKLSDRRFRANRSTKLGLNHTEGCFDIRPLMIMFQENIPIEAVEVPHTTPQTVELFTTLDFL